MPLNADDVQAAQDRQHAASRDASSTVRLVAGPGTGKSASIEERFRWLYEDGGIDPRHVFGVSFTRAASQDLKRRVVLYCDAKELNVAEDQVRVSTLHSLALTILALANQLVQYPVRPLVLDEWEVEHVFEAEFAKVTGWTPTRCEEIRKGRDAFSSTGEWNPANYLQPDPPITDAEHARFSAFHAPTTQTYAAVLPGEIVRLCVERIEAGLLDAAQLVEMQHLVVDEYQDLNPMDIQFVDRLQEQGVHLFAAGDDDQSVYSFRFASPAGIQEFLTRHPASGDHVLESCFRSATSIAVAATALIGNFSSPARILKTLASLWTTAEPGVPGVVHRWRFNDHMTEASAIVASCRSLIDAGVAAEKIMILLSNRRLFARIKTELEAKHVSYVPPSKDAWRDADAGRFMLGLLRVVMSEDDYMALRLVLGCPRGVGAKTCAQIVALSVANNLRYRDLFYEPLPAGLFKGTQKKALERAKAVCGTLAAFDQDTTLAAAGPALRALLAAARSEDEAVEWDTIIANLPDGITIAELRDYISADNEEQLRVIRQTVRARLGLADEPAEEPVPCVRVMTMHGAKGLQADVVFIPGLEDEILPGPRRTPVAGLVLEGARLLYVSMTRARCALIVTLARERYWMGETRVQTPSRYATHLSGAFIARTGGLTGAEHAAITDTITAMAPP